MTLNAGPPVGLSAGRWRIWHLTNNMEERPKSRKKEIEVAKLLLRQATSGWLTDTDEKLQEHHEG